MRVPFTDLGTVGLIKDVGGHHLPFTAWTDSRNVRYVGPYVEKVPGYSSVQSATVPPYFVSTFPSALQTFHVYAGLEKVYAFIGTQTAEITRVSDDYNGGANDFWNAAIFGGILLLNNGVDVPQVWDPPSLSQVLVDLPNWPASTTAKILRAFKNYLIAIDVTKIAGQDRRLVKWSSSASIGVPTSWDETDPTVEAGEQTLPEGQDALIDCLPLGDVNVVYGESSTWAMILASIPFVFDFRKIFPTSGILAQGCACNLGPPLGMHFVVTLNDCIVHNGQSFESLFEARMKDWFFDSINPMARELTRTVVNRKQKEVWILFPFEDSTVLNRALVWNWVHNTWHLRDIPQGRSAVEVPLEVSSDDAWGQATGTWSSDTTTWGSAAAARAALNSLLIGDLVGNKILLVDNSLQADGEDFVAYVERKGLDATLGREGAFHDPQHTRMGLAVFPQIEGSASITFTVKLGHHDTPEGEITWDSEGTWSPGDEKVEPDLTATGRYLAIRFEESSDLPWRAYGFELDQVVLGDR